jgi:hypothetical protein
VVARRIALFLRFMRGRVVSTDMLVEYVYGDRLKGPPRNPVQVFSATVRSLRVRGCPVVGDYRGFVWDEERRFRQRRESSRSQPARG